MDPPLSETGKDQALAVARAVSRLDIQCLVSSNLARSIETASIISSETGIAYNDRIEDLREFAPGTNEIEKSPLIRFILWKHWPLLLREKVAARTYKMLVVYFLIQWRRGKTKGGDSLSQIRSRIKKVFSELDAHPAKRIAVVGHGYWIMFMALLVLGNGKLDFLRLNWVENCSITAISSDGQGNYKLEFFAQNKS